MSIWTTYVFSVSRSFKKKSVHGGFTTEKGKDISLYEKHLVFLENFYLISFLGVVFISKH